MPAMIGRKPDPSTSLCYNTALLDFKSVLKAININPQGYGEHSGRRGGTTAAAAAGASVLELMLQGRWASEALYRQCQKRSPQICNPSCDLIILLS